MTHIYACVWWYIGTVGQPSTLDEYEHMFEGREEWPAHWVYFYVGLGTQELWPNSVAIRKQYLMSFYWMASTLSTSALVGDTTPKNAIEITWTIWCMLTTLTLYAYVMVRSLDSAAFLEHRTGLAGPLARQPPGRALVRPTRVASAVLQGEITNIVMSNDEALVVMREEVAKVQTYIRKRSFPRDLAQDIVSTYYDDLNASHDTERIVHLLSSGLRVEVAMHTSLPLLKRSELFTQCSSGFIASVAILLRELTMAGEEVLFRANDVCMELYIIATNTVNLTVREQSGQDTIVAVKRKGDTVGEIAFFFRLRHLTAASLGKAQATLYALSLDDYQQLSATYADDDNKLIEGLTRTVEATGPAGKSQTSFTANQVASEGVHDAAKVRRTIDAAVRRQTENHVIAFIEAAASNDTRIVSNMLEAGNLDVDQADYGARAGRGPSRRVAVSASRSTRSAPPSLPETHQRCTHAPSLT